MRVALSLSANRLHYGQENGFLSVSVVLELGPHMLGFYRWPKERGIPVAGWIVNLVKTWTDERTRKIEQRKLTLYPVQEG